MSNCENRTYTVDDIAKMLKAEQLLITLRKRDTSKLFA